MQKRTVLLATLLLFLSFAVSAQNGTIKGFVYDKKTGEPMIYTSVLFQGVKMGVQTDINGFFSISLPAGSYTMYTTSLGYDTATVYVNLLPTAVVEKKLLIGQFGHELQGVEISARKTEKITHINAGTTTITPRDIQLLPSAGGEPDVAQYLQVVPGVVFTGDQGGQLYIRGGSPAQTGVYLDGVTIYNPIHSIGLYSVFETDVIRSADVYSAAFDAQYGNRTSAIVDVHTRDGNKNELAGIVSVSPLMTRAVLEGPLVKSKKKDGSGITFLLTAKDSYLDQTSKSIYGPILGQPFSNGLLYSFTDVYGKVTFSSGNGSKLNLFGFSYTDKAQLQDSSGVANSTPYLNDYHWQARGGGGTFVLSPGSSSALIDGKFAYSNYNIGFDRSIGDSLPQASSISGFEAAINFTYFLPGYSELKYGIEVSGTATSLSYPETLNATTSYNQQSTLAGVYLMYRKDFSDKFVFEPSVRIQYYSELSKLSPEPRIGLKYNISDNVRLKAAGGIYSQNIITTKSDLDVVNLFTGFLLSPDAQINNYQGNPVKSDLQTAYHALLGLEVDIKRVELNLEPWYKDFPQIIELNNYRLLPTDPAFVAAAGKAYGVDLSAKYNYNRVYLWGTVGMQKVVYTNVGPDGAIQDYPPPFDALLNLNLLASYTAGRHKDWDLSVRFNLRSPFPFTQTQGFYEQLQLQNNGINTNVNQQNGLLGLLYANDINGGLLSYYHRLDVSAKKKFPLGKSTSLDATFSITNVYNRQNVFYVDRLTNVVIYQLPIFPSLNLTLNF